MEKGIFMFIPFSLSVKMKYSRQILASEWKSANSRPKLDFLSHQNREIDVFYW
jgi:hypothetical protein